MADDMLVPTQGDLRAAQDWLTGDDGEQTASATVNLQNLMSLGLAFARHAAAARAEGIEAAARECERHGASADASPHSHIKDWNDGYVHGCLDAAKAIRRTLTLASSPVGGEERALKKIVEFVRNYFEPWGSWKTAWWEGEVSDEATFSDGNALKHVANIASKALSEGSGR